jgi:hypothetical protein
MKNFLNFLSEAKESQASVQAKRLGLRGDGHGGWYDTKGEFVAKTIKGELKFYDKGQITGERDKPQQPKNTNQQTSPAQPKVSQKKPVIKSKNVESEVKPSETSGLNSIAVVFGRFNPPTVVHEKFLNSAYKLASGGEFRIYPSRIQDPKKNPLDPDTKIEYMKKMFPKFEENIINNDKMVNVFDVLQGLNEDGFNDVTIVVGSDRLGEFKNLANKYNGEMYNYENINIVSVGKDPDSDAMGGKTSSSMRKSVLNNDFNTFKSGIPKSLKEKEIKSLFSTLKKSMSGISEQYQEWEISPKTDWRGLRENYIKNKIYNVDEYVQNLNTGLVGKIIRRGTNYLICVTENDIMFKSWIYDVKEWTDISGVSADKREVGTDALRKYTMKMTNTVSIKNFINKYKVKK